MKQLGIILCLTGLLCLLVIQTTGQTLSLSKIFGRYQQFVWQDQHGLPQNGISAIVRTPDGYLWLATAEGIVRFDGVRFTTFDTTSTTAIKSNNIMSLLVDRTGALWAGTHGGGLNRYRDGRFTLFTTADGLADNHVRCLFEDRAGNIWAGTDGGGLNLFQNGRFTTVYTTRDGLPDNHIYALAEDSSGSLWIGTNGGLAQFRGNHLKAWTVREGLAGNAVRALCADRTGDLWIGMEGGLNRLRDGRLISYGPRDGFRSSNVKSIYQDRDGTLWFGTIGSGLCRFRDEQFEFSSIPQGLASDEIQAIFQDQEGSLWLGTSGGGLAQLRDGQFSVYTTADGLPHDMVRAVFEDRDGRIWIGTAEGLCRFSHGRITEFREQSGRSQPDAGAISQDRAGNLWINARNQTAETWTTLTASAQTPEMPDRVKVCNYRGGTMLEDRAGNIWIGSSFDGLRLIRQGQTRFYRKQDGLADDYVTALFEDRAGNIWIGTRAGLSRLSNGHLTTWTNQEGFAGTHVLSFHEDRAGQLWIGTHGDGLFRFSHGRFATISSRHGLFDNLAHQILEDDAGNLWLSGNKGIYRASLAELNEVADGRSSQVHSFAYDAADGMLSRECNGASPAGIRARDGRLWFPTIKGVVVVDPRKLSQQAPVVMIEDVTLDRVALPVGQPFEIRPGQENLEIQYTALSWNRPQQIRFKYQLVGMDQGWVEAGRRRTAYYPHLAPGEYTFRVIADNGEGVWNETGTGLRFTVIPPFYRTWWFLSLALAAGAGLILSGYKLRVRQLERATAVQKNFSRRLISAHEGERQRIAAELHDGLSQSLAIIRQRATICLQAAGDPERQQEQMQEIAEAATAVIDEVREIIYDLRPVQLDRLGLTRSIAEMLDKIARAHGLTIAQELDDLDHLFSKDAENSIYRILQESINNIIRHARASHAIVSMKIEAAALRMVIEDDGCGFIPDATRNWASGSGLGLTGILERTRLLGGETLVESAPQQGTTITIVIPLTETSPDEH